MFLLQFHKRNTLLICYAVVKRNHFNQRIYPFSENTFSRHLTLMTFLLKRHDFKLVYYFYRKLLRLEDIYLTFMWNLNLFFAIFMTNLNYFRCESMTIEKRLQVEKFKEVLNIKSTGYTWDTCVYLYDSVHNREFEFISKNRGAVYSTRVMS